MKRIIIVLIVFGLLLSLLNFSLKEWAKETLKAIENFNYEDYLTLYSLCF